IFRDVVAADGTLKKAWADRGIVLSRYRIPAVGWIIFNMTDPVLGVSRSLRQALCLSFDVDAYLRVSSDGRHVRATNVVATGLAGHKEAGPGKYYRLDRKAAKAKMAQARKELEAAGMLVDGGVPTLKLDISGATKRSARYGKLIAAQFAEIGVKVQVVENDWPTLVRKIRQGKSQMHVMGWHADYPDAENFLQLYYSKNIRSGVTNLRYSNPEFDKLYDRSRTMSDSPARTKIYARMINIISEDCPVLLLNEPVGYQLRHRWVRNVKPYPFAHGLAQYWRIDPALQPRRKAQPIEQP
ncbi:hypothetical protein LCGC14_2149980, partial [marine sediment metagenome]